MRTKPRLWEVGENLSALGQLVVFICLVNWQLCCVVSLWETAG